MNNQYLPDDDENPEHLRHQRPLDLARGSPFDLPARWYRIQKDYVATLIAMCDYFKHTDAHKGTPSEKELAVARWGELQIYLMQGSAMAEEGEDQTTALLCEEVAACIDSGNLDDTLTQYITNNEYPQNADEVYLDHPVSTVNVIEECDADKVYGFVVQMVDFQHAIITDFFHILVASVNWAQKLAATLGNIPIVGSLTFGILGDLVAVLTEDIQENYDASYTESVRQDYICDIFCLVMENCSLNLLEQQEYYMMEFAIDVKNMTFYDFCEFAVNFSFGGSEWSHLMHAFLVSIWMTGSSFLKIEPETYNGIMRGMWNDPDPDWAVVCDACGAPSYILLDFTESHAGFTTTPDGIADWRDAVGFITEGSPDTSTLGTVIEHTFDEEYTIVRMRATYSLKWGATSTVKRPHSIDWDGSEGADRVEYLLKGRYGGVYERTLDCEPVIPVSHVQLLAKAGAQDGGSYAIIRRLELWFDGPVPDEFL